MVPKILVCINNMNIYAHACIYIKKGMREEKGTEWEKRKQAMELIGQSVKKWVNLDKGYREFLVSLL
jgi:hypothetical protein